MDLTTEDTRDGIDSLRMFTPVAFQRTFVDWTGSINAALMLSQLAYWTCHTHWGRWIYKTAKEWTEELGLTGEEQYTARRKLRESGLVEEKRDGIPAKLYFRINRDEYLKRVNCSMRKTLKQHRGSSSHCIEEDPQTNTKTTIQKITTHTATAGLARVTDGEKCLKFLAGKLGDFILTTYQVNKTQVKSSKIEKQLRWLLQYDLKGDLPRLKRVVKLYTNREHDRFTPKIYSGHMFREKFLQIEAWVNKYEPPPAKEKIKTEVVARRVIWK